MSQYPPIDVEDQHWKEHPKHRPYQNPVDFELKEVTINEAPAFESFILAPGEKKVEEKIDTRMPNTSIFTFNKEDHTIGNLLRSKLLTNSHVTFSAYKVPHPLFPKFELRVSTDGEITPKQAVQATCRELVRELGIFKTEFRREYDLRKMVGNAQDRPQQ